MSRHIWYTLLAFAILAGSTFALAQKESGQRAGAGSRVNATNTTARPGSTRPRDAKPPMALTSSRKAAALEFAKQHHPELADLLRGLETRNRNAYHRAMRQLYQTSERLARSKERLSPERFELELEAWKLDSRIRLLAARVSVSKKKDPKLDAELKHALMERVDIRVRKMQQEKERLVQRVDNLTDTIKSIEDDREKAATQYLNRINRGLGIKNRKPRPAKRKAAKRKRREANKSSNKKKNDD